MALPKIIKAVVESVDVLCGTFFTEGIGVHWKRNLTAGTVLILVSVVSWILSKGCKKQSPETHYS